MKHFSHRLVVSAFNLIALIACNSSQPSTVKPIIEPATQTLPTSNKGFEPKTEVEARNLQLRLQGLERSAKEEIERIKKLGLVATPAPPQQDVTTFTKAAQPALDPSLLSPEVAKLHSNSTPPSSVSSSQQSQGVSPQATSLHGFTGWSLKFTGTNDGFYSSNTANTTIDMPTSPYWFGTRSIYAPTMKTTNACVEVLTSTLKQNYFWVPALYHEFWVWNWCSGNPDGQRAYIRTIDTNFINTYMRVLSQSVSPEPQYSFAAQRQSDGLWHVLLYNYNNNGWEDVYSSPGTVPDSTGTGGWAGFEMYMDNACPFSLPTIFADGIQVRLYGFWRPVSLSDGGPFNASSDCSENGFYAHLTRSTKQAQTSQHPYFPFSGAHNLTAANTLTTSVSVPYMTGRQVTAQISVTSLGKRDGTTTLTSGSITWGDGTNSTFSETPVGNWLYINHTYVNAGTYNIFVTGNDNQGYSGTASTSVTVY
jgi:hypothetical protein